MTGDDTPEPRIRILVAADRSIVRDGLCRLIAEEPGFTLLGEAATLEDTLRLARDCGPDLLLLDPSMDGDRGIDVLDAIGTQVEEASPKVLLLAPPGDSSTASKAVVLGADGVISTLAPVESLFKGIRAVLDGEMWIDRETLAEVFEALQHGNGAEPKADGIRNLTRREIAIVRAVVDGQVNKDIAESFCISNHTVKHHLTRIFKKLGVSNRVELAMSAISHSLTDEGLNDEDD
jgi:DNA-binding NarL/FixJ family response regulator